MSGRGWGKGKGVTAFMGVASWVTAIATAVLVGVTWWYASLTERLLESQSRPLVLIEAAYINNDGKCDRPCVRLKNHGSGPAIEVTLTIEARISPISNSDSPTFRFTVKSPMPIGQGQEIYLVMVPKPVWYPPEHESPVPIFHVVIDSMDEELLFDHEYIKVGLSYKAVGSSTYEAFFYREEDIVTRIKPESEKEKGRMSTWLTGLIRTLDL